MGQTVKKISVLLTADYGKALAGIDAFTAGVGALGLAFQYTSAKSAVTFEKEMRNVNTIAQLGDKALQGVSKAVQNFSEELGLTTTKLARALYNINSASFAGAKGLHILKIASKAAVAGLSDVSTSAKTITAILNAYGKSAYQAEDVSNMLFKTVKRGVTTFAQLSAYMGSVAATAAASKVPFEEILASIATMTKGGMDTAIAFTSLNTFMNRVAQGGEALNRVFAKVGFRTASAALETLKLRGFMKHLTKETGGSIVKLKALGFQIRDLRVVTSLARRGGKDFAKDVLEIGNRTNRAGAMQEAFNEQMKATAFTFKRLAASWEVFKQNMGTPLLAILSKVAGAMATILRVFNKMPTILQKIVSWVTALATALVSLTAATSILSKFSAMAAGGGGKGGLVATMLGGNILVKGLKKAFTGLGPKLAPTISSAFVTSTNSALVGNAALLAIMRKAGVQAAVTYAAANASYTVSASGIKAAAGAALGRGKGGVFGVFLGYMAAKIKIAGKALASLGAKAIAGILIKATAVVASGAMIGAGLHDVSKGGGFFDTSSKWLDSLLSWSEGAKEKMAADIRALDILHQRIWSKREAKEDALNKEMVLTEEQEKLKRKHSIWKLSFAREGASIEKQIISLAKEKVMYQKILAVTTEDIHKKEKNIAKTNKAINKLKKQQADDIRTWEEYQLSQSTLARYGKKLGEMNNLKRKIAKLELEAMDAFDLGDRAKFSRKRLEAGKLEKQKVDMEKKNIQTEKSAKAAYMKAMGTTDKEKRKYYKDQIKEKEKELEKAEKEKDKEKQYQLRTDILGLAKAFDEVGKKAKIAAVPTALEGSQEAYTANLKALEQSKGKENDYLKNIESLLKKWVGEFKKEPVTYNIGN